MQNETVGKQQNNATENKTQIIQSEPVFQKCNCLILLLVLSSKRTKT